MPKTTLKACPCGKRFSVYDYPSNLFTNKGKYCSLACKYKYRKRPKGLKYTIRVKNKTWFKKGRRPWNTGIKGVHFSPQTEIQKGQHLGIKTEFKKGNPRLIAKNNPRWKGGITPLNTKLRSGYRTRIWRIAVFKRDNFTCQVCHQRGGRLVPHHIKPWAKFSKLRWDVNNGITLCEKCHELTPNYKRNDNSN